MYACAVQDFETDDWEPAAESYNRAKLPTHLEQVSFIDFISLMDTANTCATDRTCKPVITLPLPPYHN